MSAPLRAYLFGPMALQYGDAALPLPRLSGARCLLAYLILHHDRPVSRDLLIGTFWPERPDAAARRALSQALWQVRRTLGSAADRLLADENTIVLHFHPGDWLDVKAFQQLCTARPSETLLEETQRLQRAIALYRADFLEDVYDDWALLERERLWEMNLSALERLITLHKQRPDYEQALACAWRLAVADPLREEAHRELMRLYHLLGRPRAALEQYTALRQRLRDELDDEPDATTTALYHEIAASLDQPAPAYLPAPPPPLLRDLVHLPFVGRRAERAALLDALQAAIHGHGGLALVEGDTGVGKTRLVNEVVADAEWRGLQVGLGKADPLAASAPYQLLREALSPLLTPLRITQLAELVEPLWLSAAAPLFAAIAEHLPDLPSLAPLDPRQEQRRLWEGIAHCLAGLASVAPLLLVLEDIHWAGEATLKAFSHLVTCLPTNRVLLVLTYRTAEARERPVVRETLDTLDRALRLLRVRLPSLERSEAVTLIQRALGTNGTDAQAAIFAGRLQDETGGNAFFLVETLKSLLERGALAPLPDGGWAFPRGDQRLPTPASVRELVGERLTGLTSELRAVLELAAVFGEDADFPVLSQASHALPVDLAGRLEALCRRGFLVESRIGYRFEHDLVREAVYRAIAAISPQRRQALHRRASEALESLHPEWIESLALHFDRGGMREKALIYIRQAGERAQAVYDHEAALAHYRRASALVGDDLPARWDVLAQQERVLDVLSHRETQAEVLDEMLRLAEALDDPLRRARTYHRQGWREVLAGKPARALSLLDEATALARVVGERDLLSACLTSAARAWWRIGDVARCQAAVEEARTIFQETGDRRGELGVLNMLGNLHLGLTGNYAQALVYFEENWRVAHELGDLHAEASAQGNVGITCTLLGCYRRSHEALAEAFQVMTRVGDRHWQGIILHWQGANHRGLGDPTQAQTVTVEALGICREVGNRNFEIAALELLGLIALDRHDPGQARLYFQRAVEVAQANQQTMDWAINQSHLALACLHLGRLEEAGRLSEQAVTTLEGLGERLSHMHEVCFERYQVVVAREGLEAARPNLERAYRHLMEMAADIQDPTLRRSFLEKAGNQAILTAHRLGRLATPLRRQTVRLPAASAPTGRPLRDDEWVEITWTVAAPEDDAISSKACPERRRRIARRRHRLLRLLREAPDQGAAPTVPHLAKALKVSVRTIKRDLAALRAAGHPTPTRGRRS